MKIIKNKTPALKFRAGVFIYIYQKNPVLNAQGFEEKNEGCLFSIKGK